MVHMYMISIHLAFPIGVRLETNLTAAELHGSYKAMMVSIFVLSSCFLVCLFDGKPVIFSPQLPGAAGNFKLVNVLLPPSITL